MLIKKTEVVKLYTSLSAAYEYARPDKASKFLPEWWKNLPKDTNIVMEESPFPIPTMKTCRGLIDMYQSSFAVPMWCDLGVYVGKQGTDNLLWKYSNEKSFADTHNSPQWGNHYSPESYAHLKVVTPWVLESDKDTTFLMTNPVYNQDDLTQYQIMPGCLEFKYQHSLNANMFFMRKKEDTRVTIPFQKVLCLLTPLTNKKIKFEHHLVSDEELLKKHRSALDFVSFTNAYMKSRKASQECPFHK